MKSFPFVLLAVSAACAPVTAVAAPQSFFELSNFKITLSDLTPDDGIAAGYTYAENRRSAVAGRFGPDGFLSPVAHLWNEEKGAVSVVTDSGTAAVSYEGDRFRSQVNLWAGKFLAESGVQSFLRLDPFTRVTISYDWVGMNDWGMGPNGKWTSALGYAGLYAGWADQFGEYFSLSSSSVSGLAGELGAGTLSLTLDSGAAGLQAYFSATTSVSGYGPALDPAVDVVEPGSIGLMLSGLAGLTMLRRRRK